MALKAGTVADFENSMAEAMENALKAEWPIVKKVAFPENDPEDRRLLFVAIAQGIVRHLEKNAETAIIVHSVEVTQDNDNNITSSGDSDDASDGISHSHFVSLTQDSGSGNRVVCGTDGSGKVRIETIGDLH